jgi:hypothetical protein
MPIKMMKITNRYSFLIWFYAIIIVVGMVGTVFYFTCSNSEQHHGYIVKTIQTENGFGYEILANDHVYIRQEFIPAIPGNRSFKTAREAMEIGDMVATKLENGQTPVISMQEIIDKKIQIE